VGGNRKSWEAAGSRGRCESETIFRAKYIGVATRQHGRGGKKAGREARTLRVKESCQLCGNCLIGDVEVPGRERLHSFA
jgi:hypothetical protein